MMSETAADLGRVALLIPAWQPDGELPNLLAQLVPFGFGRVILVDDGSAPECAGIFTAASALANVQVLRHGRNQGKGASLKTGMQAFLGLEPGFRGLVTADADGQHTPEDIARVGGVLARGLAEGQPRFVLGTRNRGAHPAMPAPAKVPLRSALGNWLTKALFARLYGLRLADTQTGLRGFSRELLPELLALPGERYEYEMAVLVQLSRLGVRPVEVPISTVYLEGNTRSHFRPLTDSLRVYAALLRPLWRFPRRREKAEAARVAL